METLIRSQDILTFRCESAEYQIDADMVFVYWKILTDGCRSMQTALH